MQFLFCHLRRCAQQKALPACSAGLFAGRILLRTPGVLAHKMAILLRIFLWRRHGVFGDFACRVAYAPLHLFGACDAKSSSPMALPARIDLPQEFIFLGATIHLNIDTLTDIKHNDVKFL